MERKHLILFGGLFAVVLSVLSAAYVLFLRPDYAVLVQDIRSQDAGAIVAELEAETIPYELGDGGRRVSVPEDRIGEARIAIAATELMAGGAVGFELFNEADMGLTEFAQKVNYQRALQGELARTIMMMEGVAFARVHLALPERTLFRGDAEAAKAAVTVQPEAGRTIGRDRVEGIRRLVAAAVTDLSPRDVSVLNEQGKLVSPRPAAEAETDRLPDERTALENYYRARVRKAVEPFLAGLPFTVRVAAIDISPAEKPDAPAAKPLGRNFGLRVALRTEVEIAESDRVDLQRAIENAVAFDSAKGDIIRLEIAPLENLVPAEIPLSGSAEAWAQASPLVPAARTDWISTAFSWLSSRWFWLALLAIAAVALPLWRRSARMSEEERQSFAEALGKHIDARRDHAHV